MRVIAKARLVKFWEKHSQAEAPLTNWYNHVSNKSTIWGSFTDVRRDYRSADKIGECYVFDIGGNNFRLVAKIIRECVYVLRIMTHREYDEQKWVTECKCMEKLRKDQKTATQKRKKPVKKVKRKK